MIEVFPSGPFSTNAYIVFCPQLKVAAIIDPAPESLDRLKTFLKKMDLKLEKVLLTHSHWDHFGDLKKLLKEVPVPVYVHPYDKQNLQEPGCDGLPLLIQIEGVEVADTYDEGDVVEVGELRFKVIHTPGHSPGGVCLYCKEHQMLISGDTLFKGSIGNLSFPTADSEKMWTSLDKLAKLPPETKVYPGHGEMTTIGEETWLKNARHIFN